jgi:hypothetical protein
VFAPGGLSLAGKKALSAKCGASSSNWKLDPALALRSEPRIFFLFSGSELV